MNKCFPFVAAVLVLLIAFLGMIYYQERIVTEGERIILETRPVDPRDLFRGEYVILRYAIESDDLVEKAALDMPFGSLLYLKLEEDERGIAGVSEVNAKQPGSGGVWVAGEVTSRGVRFPDIEQFYVPEGSGGAIEDFRTDLHVDVAVKDTKMRVIRLLDADLRHIDPGLYLE